MADAVLIVEDDVAIGKVVRGLLAQHGFDAVLVGSAEDGLAALEKRAFDVVLSDVRLPGLDGIGLLDRLVADYPDLPVVLITAHGSVALAVDAMKRGAADFVQKPFDPAELVFALGKALAGSQRQRETSPAAPRHALVGSSAAMREVLAKIDKVAPTNATVLVTGETGTGKELVAHAIHERSPRKSGPLVVVHCAALPETLLESELFGHEKGAFTGAIQRKPGRIELAHRGTLFLDEIGDVPLAMQAKLLRVLQEREFERVGGSETVKVDIRVIAATHVDLEAAVKSGGFREDLYYRLAVVPIVVPPLRERTDEIAAFVAERGGGRFTADAVALLSTQPWPGNVRQLENFVSRLLVLADKPRIDAAAIQAELGVASLPASSLDDQKRGLERAAVQRALAQAADNRTRAAQLLGVSRRTFYNKLKEHGLE